MLPALYVSKTGLSAQNTQLSTISNNLANASTVGFKRERAVFEDLFYQVQRQPGAQSTQDTQLPSGLQVGTGARVVGTQKEFTTGSMQVTDNALDVAIDGRGFLQVLSPTGEINYTRNGQFHLSADGEIVTANGLLLQPAITVPQGTTQITIGDDGVVSVVVDDPAAPQQIGQFELADFVNPAGLQAVGGNLFQQTAASGDPLTGNPGLNGLGNLKQGALENSNVDIVEEMVNMITTQRVYELNSKVVSSSDQMMQYITQNL
ncbi:flagellar basal-body rod protein FlgG [Pseudomaricurvus alkylphenolicus]|jgi:flagellar basal-body rod protein FlgG|uniref:flagellar basal-body rod protein FlgG n=1 Tax=Pseudomaricurvus alkylphenolicus TaxID=1306991 RepID=UPI0014248623|nr:flagellar basal-body rod protein FlgG [Pseudomaricurvus alkylphenolicus]NIB43255.1 flagellar basal-body rod protein FlgG [Pseudomaricurvus alkylphenolicus]